MITIKAEWEMRTELGTTRCEAYKTIFRNYRDIDNVEEAVEWVKKLFNSKKYNNPMVDFCYDNDTAYGFTVSRYFKEWSEGYSMVYFNGFGHGIKSHLDKFTKKDIRNAYLDCADKCMDYEEEVKANAD